MRIPAGPIARQAAGISARRCALACLCLAFSQAAAGAGPAEPPLPREANVRVVEDFEGGLEGWVPRPQQVESPVRVGKRAGVWPNPARVACLRCVDPPRNWSAFGRLQFWCHSAKATRARFLVVVSSEDRRAAGLDYYHFPVTVDWAGWRKIGIPFRAFRVSRKPRGWAHVDSFAFYSTGFAECFPVAGTYLAFDEITLAADPGGDGLLADFEDDTAAWQGLVRDASCNHGGAASGRWENLGATPFTRTLSIPRNWMRWDALELALHAGAANGQKLKLLAYSDNPRTRGIDCYVVPIAVDWEGWRTLHLSLARDFQAVRQPLGWSKVSSLTLAGGGWGLQPLPDTLLHLDDIRLVREPRRAGCLLSDMEEYHWPWSGLEPDTARARSGSRSGRWRVSAAVPSIRLARVPRDWRTFTALSFWCYSPDRRGPRVKVLLRSNDPLTPRTDCYTALFRVVWEGWREIRIRREDFYPNHHPAGWAKIEGVTLAASGWGMKLKGETTLWLDDVTAVTE